MMNASKFPILYRTLRRIVPTETQKMVHPRMHTSGALDMYAYIDIASALGREYPDLQLSGIVADDAKIKDLAITGK